MADTTESLDNAPAVPGLFYGRGDPVLSQQRADEGRIDIGLILGHCFQDLNRLASLGLGRDSVARILPIWTRLIEGAATSSVCPAACSWADILSRAR